MKFDFDVKDFMPGVVVPNTDVYLDNEDVWLTKYPHTLTITDATSRVLFICELGNDYETALLNYLYEHRDEYPNRGSLWGIDPNSCNVLGGVLCD